MSSQLFLRKMYRGANISHRINQLKYKNLSFFNVLNDPFLLYHAKKEPGRALECSFHELSSPRNFGNFPDPPFGIDGNMANIGRLLVLYIEVRIRFERYGHGAFDIRFDSEIYRCYIGIGSHRKVSIRYRYSFDIGVKPTIRGHRGDTYTSLPRFEATGNAKYEVPKKAYRTPTIVLTCARASSYKYAFQIIPLLAAQG